MKKIPHYVYRISLETASLQLNLLSPEKSREELVLQAISEAVDGKRATLTQVREIGSFQQKPILAIRVMSGKGPRNVTSADGSVSREVLESLQHYCVVYYIASHAFLLVSSAYEGFKTPDTTANRFAKAISASASIKNRGDTKAVAKKIQSRNDVARVLSDTSYEVKKIVLELPPPNPLPPNQEPVATMRAWQNAFSTGKATTAFDSLKNRALVPTGDESIPLRRNWVDVLESFQAVGGWLKGKFKNPKTQKIETLGDVPCSVELPLILTVGDEPSLDAVFKVSEDDARKFSDSVMDSVRASVTLYPPASPPAKDLLE